MFTFDRWSPLSADDFRSLEGVVDRLDVEEEDRSILVEAIQFALDDAYSVGHDTGRDEGYDDGHADGVDEGYEDGYNDARAELGEE